MDNEDLWVIIQRLEGKIDYLMERIESLSSLNTSSNKDSEFSTSLDIPSGKKLRDTLIVSHAQGLTYLDDDRENASPSREGFVQGPWEGVYLARVRTYEDNPGKYWEIRDRRFSIFFGIRLGGNWKKTPAIGSSIFRDGPPTNAAKSLLAAIGGAPHNLLDGLLRVEWEVVDAAELKNGKKSKPYSDISLSTPTYDDYKFWSNPDWRKTIYPKGGNTLGLTAALVAQAIRSLSIIQAQRAGSSDLKTIVRKNTYEAFRDCFWEGSALEAVLDKYSGMEKGFEQAIGELLDLEAAAAACPNAINRYFKTDDQIH